MEIAKIKDDTFELGLKRSVFDDSDMIVVSMKKSEEDEGMYMVVSRLELLYVIDKLFSE